MKPQVLFVVDHEYNRCVRLKNQVTLLNRLGVDCHVVEFKFTGSQGIGKNVNANLTLHTIYAPSILHKFRALSAELPVFQAFVKVSLRKVFQTQPMSPDVVHCYNTFAWEGVHEFFKAWPTDNRPKLVVDFAEDLPSIMREYDYVKRGLGSLLVNLKRWEKLQKKAVQCANMCIVVTEEAALDYCERYSVDRSKFLCINNLPGEELISRSTATHQSNKHPFTLLYFGDTSFRRGTDQLVRTAPRIRKVIPEYEVIIVGHNNREQSSLQDLVNRHNCNSYVHLMGFQPEIDLPIYMARSSVGVSPLKRNRHHDTTHANKLFQFMLGGLPLLVSNCTAQANLVRKHELGTVYEANNDDDFVKTVIRMHRSPNECDIWQRNALSYMDNHKLVDEIRRYEHRIRETA